MDEEWGDAVPLWAQRLLLTYQIGCTELEPRIAELKASTASKLVSFKALKEKKEKEQEQNILAETIRVNNEIMRRREQVTVDSGQFRDQIEAKLEETRELERVLHAKTAGLPKMSEALIRLESELEGLKKQEVSLNNAFKKAKAVVSEESKKVALADPAWADLDLLEPVFQTPEVPPQIYTAARADTVAGAVIARRDPILVRPSSSNDQRKEANSAGQAPNSPSSTSSSAALTLSSVPLRSTRAGRAEVVRILIGDRPRAIVESFMRQHRYTLQAIIETLQKDEDPLDPIDPASKTLMARGIQNVHTYYGRDIEFIEWLIKFEIGRANEPKQVFAEGSTALYMLSTFALRYGSIFLKDSIRETIFKILKEDKPYELNPDKVVKNVGWVDLNIKSVKQLAYDLLIEIVGSCFKIPMQLRKVASFLRNEMVRKFPNDGFNMIARLLFDGLFCKAIERPDDVNMDINDVSDKMRPLLKVLSQMLSRVSRNEPFTEDIYLPLNEFISNYLGLSRKFLTDTIKPADREIWASVTPMPLSSCIEDIDSSLKKLSLAHLVGLSKRITELDAQSLYCYNTSYQYHERLKIVQDYTCGEGILANMEKTHPFADELLDILFDEDCALVDSIAAVAAPKQSESFDLHPLASSIVKCSLYKDPTGAHAEYLIRSMLRKEMAALSNTNATSQSTAKLLVGFGAAMYTAFSTVLAAELLQEVIPPLLEGIRKGKYGKLDKKGCTALAQYIESLGNALHRLPVPMWKLASYLTRQLMDPGPSLFLVCLIGRTLETNPTKYMAKMPTDAKEKEKFLKRVVSVKLFFQRVATTEPFTKTETKYFAEANALIKETHDTWFHTNDAWSAKEPAMGHAPLPTLTYTWEEARSAIKLWMDFVDSDSSFELLLTKQIKTSIAYTLGDLFLGWALPIGPRAASIVLSASPK